MSLELASKAPLDFCGFVLTAEGDLFKDAAESPRGQGHASIVMRGSDQPWSLRCRVTGAVREEGYQLAHRTSSSSPRRPVHTEPRDTLTMGTSDSESQATGVRHCLPSEVPASSSVPMLEALWGSERSLCSPWCPSLRVVRFTTLRVGAATRDVRAGFGGCTSAERALDLVGPHVVPKNEVYGSQRQEGSLLASLSVSFS